MERVAAIGPITQIGDVIHVSVEDATWGAECVLCPGTLLELETVDGSQRLTCPKCSLTRMIY